MNEKKKPAATVEQRVIAGVVLFLVFAGGVTGIILAVMGLVIYQIIKRNIGQGKDGETGRPAPRWHMPRSAPLSGQARMRREKALEARRETVAAAQAVRAEAGETRRRQEELEDLLRAGIIEQDEYRDRLQDLLKG